MANFRFIHAADLHLDSPFKGIGKRVPEAVYYRLRSSTFAAFDRLVRLCIDERVDFLCIAGDVFDLADRSLRAQSYFQKKMRELQQEKIRVYVIHGNHDPADGEMAPLEWPDNVHFFSAEMVEAVPFVKNGQELARIYGRSYPTAHFTERIIEEYRRNSEVPFAIGLMHTNLDGHPSHDNYAPCAKKDLLAKDFDYWALGHIHQPGIVHEGAPWIVYAGNIQGRSMKETGPRGCYLVDVQDNRVDKVTFIETDDVRWHTIRLDVTGAETLQSILDRIQDEVEGIADGRQGRAVVVRCVLTGATDVHDQLKPADQLFELLDPYLEEYVHQPHWLFVESIHIRTQPLISRETIMEESSFLSDYLHMVEESKTDPEQLKVLHEDVLHAVYGHREGRRFLEPLTNEELRELLDEVQDLAIRLFSR